MPRQWLKINEQPQLRKNKDNTYSFRFKEPTRNGNRIQGKWQRTNDTTKSDAKRTAEKYRKQREKDINDYDLDEHITFGEYARQWHNDREDSEELTYTSWRREEITIKDIEQSCIADIPLIDLTVEDIDKLVLENRKKKYSNDKRRRILQKTTQILKHATIRRRIKYNPATAVKPIKPVYEKQRKAIPPELITQLTNDIEQERKTGSIVAIRIGIGTGARRGEILGLEWPDIDLENQEIAITKQLTAAGEIAPPKFNSTGVIPIDDDLTEYLKQWKKEQERKFETDIVCTNTKGNYIDPHNFNRWYKRYFADHGLGHWNTIEETKDKDGFRRLRYKDYEGYTFHELRHTMATDLLSDGADLKSVQSIMRHQKITTTEGYLHEVNDKLRNAINHLAETRKTMQQTN